MSTAYDRIIAALRDYGSQVTENGDGKTKATCPGHRDRRPSLSITRICGSVLIYCQAGCQTEQVLAPLGLALRDLFDDRKGARYDYFDGRVVHRTPDKRFWQSGNTKGTALFHVERIGDAELVYIVQGEKDVLAVEAAGGVAATCAMGAGKADKFDWTPLHGRDVILVADKDSTGGKHVSDIRALLSGKARSVRTMRAAVGKDAADHIAAGYMLPQLVPVDDEAGAALLDELRDTFTKHVVFPNGHASAAVTLWTATTHALPAFDCAPRLVITSPQKRCAKTRLLDIVVGTCHDALPTSDATVAAIFRSLGGKHPRTLVIDEADAMFGNKKVAEQNEDLRKLLNAGHQRGRPALRCVGQSPVPVPFEVFAMAALAGIGDMPDTITDRAVNITLRRRAPGEKVSQFRLRRDGPVLKKLRKRLAHWAAERIDKLAGAETEMPVEDRAADTWEPLIAIADAAGGHWPKTARAACMALVAAAEEADEDRSLGAKLLADIRQVFNSENASFMSSADLVAALRSPAESPWNDFELTQRKLASDLRKFGVNPAAPIGTRCADTR